MTIIISFPPIKIPSMIILFWMLRYRSLLVALHSHICSCSTIGLQ
jgi:hypothetical protein